MLPLAIHNKVVRILNVPAMLPQLSELGTSTAHEAQITTAKMESYQMRWGLLQT